MDSRSTLNQLGLGLLSPPELSFDFIPHKRLDKCVVVWIDGVWRIESARSRQNDHTHTPPYNHKSRNGPTYHFPLFFKSLPL